MKRIVIFADGTWNSPEKGRPTNVLTMARGVKPVAGRVEQVVFYDWGVGTDRKKIAGGITGAGIDKNIMDCYRFIMHNYRSGDHLFFFGFSRGAYTVRSLAGFIRNSGLLRRKEAGRVADAFRLYRKRSGASHPNGDAAREFREKYAVADITPITFVGVWDTVGALGIPVPFWGTLGRHEFLFHDLEPSKIIAHARHAVSIDENREDFQPALWSTKPGLDLKQVWFAGVHSDVGGGYRETGLSHCACQWMIREAEQVGLVFEDQMKFRIHPDFSGRRHDERKGIYRARGLHVRTVDGPVHVSARDRWQADSGGYRGWSKALARLLESVDGDWNRVKIEN